MSKDTYTWLMWLLCVEIWLMWLWFGLMSCFYTHEDEDEDEDED